MPSKSLQAFQTLLGKVDQLISIHGQLQSGPGRRHGQDAIHRAGVVLVVAAWESYVEQVLIESFAAIEADAGLGVGASTAIPVPAWARHAIGLRKVEVTKSAKRFHTPDAAGVRDLMLESLGFNPLSHWHWRNGPRQWDEDEVRKRLNAWVTVRHTVAHGAPLPTDVEWIKDSQGRPRLHLPLLKECRKCFAHVAQQTDSALETFLKTTHGVAAPW